MPSPSSPSSVRGDGTEVAATVVGHQRRKSERPTELLEAALALFCEKGFAATRAEEVAQRAGVSKGTLYLYYASKEDLLRAVIRTYLGSEISAAAERIAAWPGSPVQGLRELLVDWWVQVIDSPASGVFKLMMAEVRNFPELADFYRQEVVEPGTRLIGTLLLHGIDRGELRPVDIDTAVHALLLPMVMLCIHKHSLGACCIPNLIPDPAAFVARHMDLLLQGLLAPGTTLDPPARP